MTSQAILTAQPKSVSDAKIASEAREAHAEAEPKKALVEVSAKKKQGVTPGNYQQPNIFDRFLLRAIRGTTLLLAPSG
jgi:hypothetical protein